MLLLQVHILIKNASIMQWLLFRYIFFQIKFKQKKKKKDKILLIFKILHLKKCKVCVLYTLK